MLSQIAAILLLIGTCTATYYQNYPIGGNPISWGPNYYGNGGYIGGGNGGFIGGGHGGMIGGISGGNGWAVGGVGAHGGGFAVGRRYPSYQPNYYPNYKGGLSGMY